MRYFFLIVGMMKPKFNSTMLDYSKLILSKMAFDRHLFNKEFRKAFRKLNDEEREQLLTWLRSESELSRLSHQDE